MLLLNSANTSAYWFAVFDRTKIEYKKHLFQTNYTLFYTWQRVLVLLKPLLVLSFSRK